MGIHLDKVFNRQSDPEDYAGKDVRVGYSSSSNVIDPLQFELICKEFIKNEVLYPFGMKEKR